MAYLGVSRRAARDIEEIRRFSVEQWGHRTAEEYVNQIEEALDRLWQNPTLLRVKADFSHNLRFFRVHRHYLVCTFVENNIYLLAVKHGSLDLPKLLAELEPSLLEETDLLHKTFLGKKTR